MFKIKKCQLCFSLLFVFSFLSLSNKAQNTNPVDQFGQLSVEGIYIVDQNKNPIQLHGMSLFWSQWMGKYYNSDCIKWLKEDWKCLIIRAAMGVNHGGYAQNPHVEFKKIEQVIEASIDLGIYVIVDFHTHQAENFLPEAKVFFSHIAQKYGHYPNVIYEIYNEPLEISWSKVIKPYSEEVIKTIRQYDSDNIIVCGTPKWSQLADEAAEDPIEGKNITYTLHFYAGSHGKELMEIGDSAIKKGICLFVTEYGITKANGDGPIFAKETQEWFKWMDQHKISSCNWSIADKNESSATLTKGAHCKGKWKTNELTPAGQLIRAELIKRDSINNTISPQKSLK